MTERLRFKNLLMEISLLNNCRMCFKVKKNSIKIFDGWNNYGSKIYAVTGIEIIESSQVPALICPDCLTLLNSAYNLRTQCRETNEKFRKILWENFEKENWSKNLKSLREDGNVEEEVNLVDIKCKVEIEEAIDEIQRFDDDFATFDEPEPEHIEPPPKIKKVKPKKSSRSQKPKPINHNKQERQREKCELCNEYAPSLRKLKRHMRDVHCDKNFQFIKFKEIYQGNLQYICDFCGKTFPNRKHFFMHIRGHVVLPKKNEKPYGPCTICGNFFRSTGALKYHERSHRRTADDFWYCDLCGSRFTTRTKIRSHIRMKHVDIVRFYCPDCPDKSFGTKYILKRHHELSHLNIRKHKCNFCPKSYQTSANLKKHLRHHTGEKI